MAFLVAIFMNAQTISALIPIKQFSERLENKNFRPFGGQALYMVILDKLQQIDRIDQIVINTDSEEIMEACAARYSKVLILQRPPFLRDHRITMNTLIDYDVSNISGEHFLQTHVTNPLLRIDTIEKAIDCYFDHLAHHDSLISVSSIQKRAYTQELEPINHCNDILLMTQDLPEILIENSNLFLFSRSSFFRNGKSRIGKNPLAFRMSEIEGLDIDTMQDFLLAELVYTNQHLFWES